MNRLFDWMRVALIDLKGDLRRFGVLLGCLALGTGTIAAVGSVGAALHSTIIRDASTLLGGDIEISRPDRRATPEELAYIESLGTVTLVTDTNARGRAEANSLFLDIMGVDGAYPLFGNVRSPQLQPGQKPGDLLGEIDGVWGAIVDPVLLDRLGIEFGGRYSTGNREYEVRGLLQSIPDSAVRGFHLGITTIVDIDSVEAGADARLPLPGLLTQHRYKIMLSEGTYEEAAPLVKAELTADEGWTVTTPYDAAGTLSRFYDRFVRFLLIVGLSALLVGGIGISNAVSAYIAERQKSLATLRSLGATGPRILVHVFTQIGVMSLVGIAIGLAMGAVATLAALPLFGPIIGVDLPPRVDIVSLLVATGFGILAAFAFSYLPLVRARKLRPASLFRTVGSSVEALHSREFLTPGVIVPLAIAALGIMALAWLTTQDLRLVLWYAAGVAGAFVLMRAAGALMQWLLRAMPAPRNALFRQVRHSIIRPGSPAPTVIMSLGLGLSMLLVIVILDRNLHSQLLGEVQQDAPTFVVTDLFEDEVPDIQAFLEAQGVLTQFRSSPMMRAAVTAVRGIPATQFVNVDEEVAFMLSGEVPITWATTLPDESTVVEGEWWPEDYDGPPLVSLRTRARDSLGLKIGDTLELTILGEKIEATVANFRDYHFRNGLNFLVTVSPHAVDGFPSSWLATMKVVAGAEKDTERALVREFPELTFIPVGESLNQLADLLGQLGTAVNIVGGLAVVNGLLVLAGTMAAGRKQREADAVVNKVLGATRGNVLAEFAAEYALLGAFAAIIATLVGMAGAYTITLRLLDVGFAIDPLLVVVVLAGAVALTIATGALTTWQALSTKPAQYLRSLG